MLAELSKAADAEGGPKFLHIVVKLADVESVYFNTSTGRELHAGQDAARPKSALTAALADSPKKSQDVGNRCARVPAPVVHLTSNQKCFSCHHIQEGYSFHKDLSGKP